MRPSLYAEGMTGPDAGQDRILTIPNLISAARVLCVPLFLWLLLARDARVASVVLLAVLGATDWVDGYIARHYDQGSELGKVLDPTADRILLGAGVVALLVVEALPVWIGVVILAREVAISVTVLALALAGARRIDVQWVGKAGTLALMFGLPAFLLADSIDRGRDLALVVAWGFTLGGLALSYYAAAAYVPLARQALRDGRAAREGSIAA